METGALLVLLAGLLAPPLSGADAAWIGYRGPNGTGVFPDTKPPVDCDMKTGRNIVWKTPLPNWGHSSPVVVKDRAFVLSEPGWKHDWPVLTCMDIATGKVLWEREVNHLPATGLDKAVQDEVAKAWHNFHAVWRELYQNFNLAVVQKKPDEAKARFETLGYVFGGHKGGGYGQLRSLKAKEPTQAKARDALFAKAGIHGESWHHGCGLGTDCIGMAYASPVSDGQHVFVTTTYSGAACYDLEGNLRWMAFVPTTGRTEAYARSPMLYRDLFISDYFGKLVAFDKATGTVRWSVATQGGSIATPAIITVAGTDIVLSEGKQDGGGSVTATRLPDGKPLRVAGWGIGGTQILVDTDRRDVAYFCGRGQHSFWPETESAVKPPVAVRFALDGETLKASVLWDGKDFVGAGGFVGMLYHGGKLYCSAGGTAVVIDAASGKLLAGTMDRREMGQPAKRPLPITKHLLLLAGDRFYGLNGSERTCDGHFETFATLYCHGLDGKLLGRSVVSAVPVEGEKLEQTRSQVGWDRWPFAYGFPFTVAGDRIYVRGFDELVCIGDK
jgi:outer membrane protein assembly factor BamB